MRIKRADGRDEMLDENDIIHVHDASGRLLERRRFGVLNEGDAVYFRGLGET